MGVTADFAHSRVPPPNINGHAKHSKYGEIYNGICHFEHFQPQGGEGND